jgi:hypothetical protein
MHLTPKTQTTRPAGLNSLQQQSKFDDFLEEFNQERPHEALGMKCPAEVYTPAARPYRGLPELAYPFHDQTIHVTNCGRICLHRKKINLSTVFAGQAVGITEVDEGIWLVSFMEYDLISPKICRRSVTMTNASQTHSLALLRNLADQTPVIRSADLKEHGIHRQTLRRAVGRGIVRKIDRGLYVASELLLDLKHRVILACRRVPHGIVCLGSALCFHGIISTESDVIWMAIDRKARKPAQTREAASFCENLPC